MARPGHATPDRARLRGACRARLRPDRMLSESKPNAALTLTFKGPFTLVGSDEPNLFESDLASGSGLYIWATEYVDGGLIVTYVGETEKTFAERMKEHAIQTLGGNYRISDPELLCKGIDRVLWNGLWRRGTRDRLPEYVESFLEFAAGDAGAARHTHPRSASRRREASETKSRGRVGESYLVPVASSLFSSATRHSVHTKTGPRGADPTRCVK